MTPEQWSLVERRVTPPWGRAKLLVDGYELTLSVERQTTMRFVIVTYVNGFIKGEWFFSDSEERRRFCRRRAHAVYSTAKRNAAIKRTGKKMARELGYFKVIQRYEPWWPSFPSLKRHLVKNNTSIELAEEPQESARE